LLSDPRNYNLLHHASESGNAKPIEALLKYGIEWQIPESEVTAQSLAWDGRHSNVLLKLFQSNLPFPPGIDVNDCSEELKSFIKICEEFHEMIEGKNQDRLDKIRNQHPNLKFLYNLSNKSALKASLDLKLIEIYELLISKNLSFAPHEDTDEIWSEFTKSEKIKLRNINLKYLKDIPEKHINVLMFNTSLSHDEADEEGKRELIHRAYRALNNDSRLKIILKIVAATKMFHIIFDFYRDSTYRIDPTTGPWTQGIFYFSGRIIIGAKQLLNPQTEHETFGVLIHELCHYAMLAVYDNQSDPYTANNQQAKEEFARISQICKDLMEEEPVIQSVFDDYPEDHQPSELIVRPPHLIALYSQAPKILQEVIATFNELFHHFINVIIPEMERALPEIEGRLVYKPTYTYSKLSDQNKLKIQNAVAKYKNVEVKLCELFPGNFEIFENLSSEHIAHLLSNGSLNFDDPQLRYLEEKIDSKWENLAENLKEKFSNSNLNFQGQIIKFKDLYEAYPDTFNTLTSQQIRNILNGDNFVIGNVVERESEFYIERKFIPEDAKVVDFEFVYGHAYVDNYDTRQEHKINRMKDKNLKEFSDEFFKQNFNDYSKVLDKVKENLLFKRTFDDLNAPNFQFMHKNANEIIDQAEKEQILILSSEAGAGKTVIFEQLTIDIKKKYPTRWVSYIDLKDYTELYKTNKNAEKLFEKILNLKNEFEVRIFQESYKSGKFVIIWNGFDEVSPVYNKFILNLIKSVKNSTKNIQLVCTRPIYSDQFRNAFKIRTWQLIPFDKNKKQVFLKEYFNFLKVSKEKLDEYIQRAEDIIKKLTFEKHSYSYRFDTPLILKLVAEVHEDEKLFKNPHIYGIFETFIEKKIELWLNKSKGMISIAKKLILCDSLKLVYQKYGFLNELNIFTGQSLSFKTKKLQIMRKSIPQNLSFEDISSMGILYINGKNEFEFTHKTFGEFFLAKYFIENVYNIEDDVNSDEAELRLELFYHLTKQYGDVQQLVTDFMTSYLQINKEQEIIDFNPKIVKLLRTKFKNFLIRMLDINYQNVFEFLFEFFKKDQSLLVDLLHINEDETFYTAIYNPKYFGFFTDPEMIKNLARNHLTDSEFEKFINGRNQKGLILFGRNFYDLISASAQDFKIDPKFLSVIVPYWRFLDRIELNKFLTVNEQKVIFIAALSPNIYLFYDKLFGKIDFSKYENLWLNFENLLSKTEIQDALGNALIAYFETFPFDNPDSLKFLIVLLKKAEKLLSNSEIFEMFLNKNILHEAHWDVQSFRILWNFFEKRTTVDERRKILLQDDLDDKNFYSYGSRNERKNIFSNYQYRYCYYDFTPFKIFHRSVLTGNNETFDLVKEIYSKHFTNIEIQQIILESNDFLYCAVAIASQASMLNFVLYLEDLFLGSEKLLKEFLERKINPTNLTIIELIEEFRGIPYVKERCFDNLRIFSILCLKIKNIIKIKGMRLK